MFRRYLESLREWPFETIAFTLLFTLNGALLIAAILHTIGLI